MTVQDIDREANKSAVKYILAKQIRQLLDDAAKTYGADDWQTDDVETEIDQLVFGD